jgi:hypothetical protein
MSTTSTTTPANAACSSTYLDTATTATLYRDASIVRVFAVYFLLSLFLFFALLFYLFFVFSIMFAMSGML